jgi:hypothetical protein
MPLRRALRPLPDPIDVRLVSDLASKHEEWHEDIHSFLNAGGGEGGGGVEPNARWVTEDGNDSNNGLSWATAYATPQAAYDELVTLADAWSGAFRKHVGKVYIAGRTDGGFYNVGEGLALNNYRTCEFIGLTTRGQQTDYQSASRLGTNSATATALILPTINAGQTSYGFKFRNLSFRIAAVNTSLVTCLKGMEWNMVDVIGCYARPDRGIGYEGWFIQAHPGNDNSWWTVENNRIQNMAFLKVLGTVGEQNNNSWWVAHNQCFMSGKTVPKAMIEGSYWYKSTIIGNWFEGESVAVHLLACGNIDLAYNHGEASNSDDPFYVMDWGWWNTITGGSCQTPNSNSGIFLLNRSATGPIVTSPMAGKTQRTDGQKNWVVDASPDDYPDYLTGTADGDPAIVLGRNGLETT